MAEGSGGKTVSMRAGLWPQEGLSRRMESSLIQRMERNRLGRGRHILLRKEVTVILQVFTERVGFIDFLLFLQ